MGIGGSGMSAVAQIAKARGFEVSGCDKEASTPYIQKVKSAGIPVQIGHDAAHVSENDIVAVTPAVFFQNPNHPEFRTAQDQGLVMTWQQFMGTHLHEGKKVICVAGTHGKSTTTAWVGRLLETAGMDPTVEVGATVSSWHSNVRIGEGEYFVSEADEYYHNFLHYHPDILIITNLEMDHPEYFHTYEALVEAFAKLIAQIKPGGTLIYNSNSRAVLDVVLHHAPPSLHQIKFNYFDIFDENLINAHSSFTYEGHPYTLSLPGRHNIENALAVIKCGHLLHIPQSAIDQTLSEFSGTGRRIELIGEQKGIKVFDDYANHPTAFMATLQAVKQLTNNAPVWAIIEPHTFSRLRALLPQLPSSVQNADHIIVSKIFASREQDPGDFTGEDIVRAMHHPDARYIPEFTDIAQYLKIHARPGDVVVVMGSGLSYKLPAQILEAL